MSSDSYQLLGMAQRGMLPRLLARRSSYGTPTYAIILSSLGVVLLGALSFQEVLELLNFLYCIAALVEFAAYLKLRWSRPDLFSTFKCVSLIGRGDFGRWMLRRKFIFAECRCQRVLSGCC